MQVSYIATKIEILFWFKSTKQTKPTKPTNQPTNQPTLLKTMDLIHCDDYEVFLHEVAFGKNNEKMKELYTQAVNEVEPCAENLSYVEQLAEDMDDCWDSEWINPITGIPHYHAANMMLPGTCIQPTIFEQLYTGAPPNVTPTWELEYVSAPPQKTKPVVKTSKQTTKKCTFCANRFGNVPRCNTHTVKDCYVLKNTKCLNCGELGTHRLLLQHHLPLFQLFQLSHFFHFFQLFHL